jgi:membrane-associated protein
MDSASGWWAYLALFLAVMASWIGVPFIGATAAGGAAIAASRGQLNLPAVVCLIVVAGEVGGLIGYHIGAKWGREIVERPGKRQARRERILAKGERAYGKWGRLAVFFTPAIVSGTAKMPHREFAIWNLVDAIGFTFLTVGGAYGLVRISTGYHARKDVLILVLGVGLGALLLALVRRHHRDWVVTRDHKVADDDR